MFNDSWLWATLGEVDEQLQGSDDRIQQLYWPQRDSDVLFLE